MNRAGPAFAVIEVSHHGLLDGVPNDSLSHHDVFAIEGGRGRAIQLVAQREGFRDSMTERCVIFTGE
ncbi:hypothetical protein A7D21_15845 [Pseudomonas sp. AP19]|jgi:hypothetical protein|nr:hypothetical protein [Pseudomonas sp.]OEC73855.1 hypothetical protein A7D21_15845 [Pseudomonas sp. AP19]